VNEELSIDRQKRARTYYRNLLIKTLNSQGVSQAALGRRFGIKRQRVHQILKMNPQRKPWWKFWGE